MAYKYLRHAALVAAFVPYVTAQSQQSDIVPEDLRSGFRGGRVEIQVSYTNRATDGFEDGEQFEKDAVSEEPTFARGDSSGISPTTLHTIIMVDTTCANKRTLHYARANFKNNFDITNIATDSDALLAYKAPGSFGETGDDRQYSFLMYINPQRRQITDLKLPAEGEAFDVKQFQTDNNLPDPQGGVGMIVKLGGTADCGGDAPNTLPENPPTAKPSTSTAARTSAGNAAPSSNAGAAPTSNANARPTSAAGGADTSAASEPSSTTAAGQRPLTPTSASSPGQNPGNQNGNSPASSAARSSGLVVVPSPTPGGEGGQSGATSVGAPGGGRPAGSPTLSGSVVEQTTNAAPTLSNERLGLLAPVFAVAGLILF